VRLLELLKRFDLWLGMKVFGHRGLVGDIGFEGELGIMHMRNGKVVTEVTT